MVIAFAGRRVDAPNAKEARFPRVNVGLVRDRVRDALATLGATVIVSAAACGADLIALEVAAERSIRRVVVLPWDRDRFRAGSVVDRGIEWGSIYDAVIDDVAARGDLTDLGYTTGAAEAYDKTNDAILDAAERMAAASSSQGRAVALVAWNRQPRVDGDVTAAFLASARRRGMKVVEISTV